MRTAHRIGWAGLAAVLLLAGQVSAGSSLDRPDPILSGSSHATAYRTSYASDLGGGAVSSVQYVGCRSGVSVQFSFGTSYRSGFRGYGHSYHRYGHRVFKSHRYFRPHRAYRFHKHRYYSAFPRHRSTVCVTRSRPYYSVPSYSRSRAVYVETPVQPRIAQGTYSAQRGNASVAYRDWQHAVTQQQAPLSGSIAPAPSAYNASDSTIVIVDNSDYGQRVQIAEPVEPVQRDIRAGSGERFGSSPADYSADDSVRSSVPDVRANHAELSTAWQLLRDGQSRAAVAAFGAQASDAPDDVAAKVGYALAALDAGEYQAAAWAARRAVNLDAGAVARNTHASAAMGDRLGQLADRIALVRSAGRADIAPADAAFLEAFVSVLAGDRERASAALLVILESGVDDASAAALGSALLRSGRSGPAVPDPSIPNAVEVEPLGAGSEDASDRAPAPGRRIYY